MVSTCTPEFRWDFRPLGGHVRRVPPEGEEMRDLSWRRGAASWRLILLPGFFIVDTDRFSSRPPNNYETFDRLGLAGETTGVTFTPLFVFPRSFLDHTADSRMDTN